jgi:hypothetical protein
MPGISAVSLYANSDVLINKLNTGTVDGPINVTPARYNFAVRTRGSSGDSAPLAAITGVVLTANENATVVAGFTATGLRKMWVSVNPTTSVASGKARVIFRHVASAPPVDVYLGSTKKVNNLVNSQQATLTIPAASNDVKVDLSNTATTVVGPTSYNFASGQTTIIYIIGSATAKTLGFATQRY